MRFPRFDSVTRMPRWKPEYLDCPFCDNLLTLAATYLHNGVYEQTGGLPDGASLYTLVTITDRITAYTIFVQQGETILHCHSDDPAVPTVDDLLTAPMGLLLEAFGSFSMYVFAHSTASDTR